MLQSLKKSVKMMKSTKKTVLTRKKFYKPKNRPKKPSKKDDRFS